MPEPKPLREGDPSAVGGYVLRGRLGEGGQGTVYLGEDASGGRVAVKTLKATGSADPVARRRFAGEVALVRQVSSFCVAEVLDADLDADPPYIVSEYIDGPSLQAAVGAEGPFEGGALRRVVVGTVTALAAVHGAGIVHRDLKPHNVLLGRDGPRVIDFGIARLLDATTTATGPIGTIAYMSPEQISGGEIGPASDIFSWASTMAYAAGGRPPFGKDSIPAVMHRVLTAEPALSGLPPDLHDLLADCLAKDPQRRPTARAILLRLIGDTEPPTGADLDRTLTETTLTDHTAPSPVESPPPAPRRRRTIRVAAGAATALVATAVAFAVLRPDSWGEPGAAPAEGALLFSDDFSDHNGWDGWTFAPDAAGDDRSPKGYEIDKGVYTVQADRLTPGDVALSPVPAKTSATTERNLMIGVTARLHPGAPDTGEFGLLCAWDEDVPNGYSLVITVGGSAHLYRNTPGARSDVVPPARIAPPRAGRDLKIQAACRQAAPGAATRLTLWVDGTRILDGTDPAGLPEPVRSQTGLVARVPASGDGRIVVTYDDFTLHRT